MADMKKYMSLMRDKAMTYGIHTYGLDGDKHKNQLFYSGYGTSFFTIEVWYDAILCMHFGNCKIVVDTLDLYLSFQQEDGFLYRDISMDPKTNRENPFYIYESEEHAQPFLFQVALLITRYQQGDVSWLSEENYERLKKYLYYWLNEWVRDDSGLCVWNGAQHGASDTAFARAGSWRSMYCAGSDLNSLLYTELCAAAQVARARNCMEDAEVFEKLAEERLALIQKYLWNEEDGIFYDYNVLTKQQIKVKHCHSFDTIAFGTATVEQAERMVREHICNPEEFWTPYPIPSYALTEPDYTQHYVPKEGGDFVYTAGEGHCNWSGGLWPHTVYMLTHGLYRYGFKKEADEIVSRMEELIEKNPLLHEWYNAETGEGLGGTPFYAGAEMLMCFLSAELKAGFDPCAVEPVSAPLHNAEVMEILSVVPIPEQI